MRQVPGYLAAVDALAALGIDEVLVSDAPSPSLMSPSLMSPFAHVTYVT